MKHYETQLQGRFFHVARFLFSVMTKMNQARHMKNMTSCRKDKLFKS